MNIFPGQICAMPFTVGFYIHTKWKPDYSLFVFHIQFVRDSLDFQLNQEKIHATLTILKVVLDLKFYLSSGTVGYFVYH